MSDSTSHCITEHSILSMLRQQSNYATVCTEPATIALCVQEAKQILGKTPHSLHVVTSPGVYKNALSAGLPVGDRKGPVTAAALGAVLNKPDKGLELLCDISGDELRQAYSMADEGRVKATCDENLAGVCVICTAFSNSQTARVVVSGSHTNVSEATLDGSPVTRERPGATPLRSIGELRNIEFSQLLDTVMAIDPSKGLFLLEGALSVKELSEKAYEDTSLRHALSGVEGSPERSGDLIFDAYNRAVVAISARMGGTPHPVMTSGGSGNQGIMVGLPVLMVADSLGAADNVKIKALMIGHAVNLFIKSYMGEISSVCGAVSAGAGTAAATAWLMEEAGRSKGDPWVCTEAAVNMALSALYGMVCDGAKGSCALKGGLAVVQGILSGKMAHRGMKINTPEGILGKGLRDTLKILEHFGSTVLSRSDSVLIENFNEGDR